MVSLGVAATRSGLTVAQLAAAVAVFGWLHDAGPVTEFHHGDCVGGDADLDAVACGLGLWRVAHPPTNDKLRAFRPADVALPPEDYKARDRAIVLASGVLVACPKEPTERPHGGTWYTVGYARSRSRPLVIAWPGGQIGWERVPDAGPFRGFAAFGDHWNLGVASCALNASAAGADAGPG